LVYVDDVNILEGSVHTVMKNSKALKLDSKEIGLEVNADKTKIHGQNAGRGQNIEIDNSSFERVEAFQYLGITLTNQNSIQEEIKSKLKSRNVCYHSVRSICLFQFVIQKFEDLDAQNCNFAYSFVWV
jgi:hypothetical protein